MNSKNGLPLILDVVDRLGSLAEDPGPTPLPGAVRYIAPAAGDGLAYRFPAGALAQARYVTADVLLEGDTQVTFVLELAEGEAAPMFAVWFSFLNQCQARIRLPLDLVDQHTRGYPREGAWKNIICQGSRVNLAAVDRCRLRVLRKDSRPSQWCMTPLTAVADEPPRLTDPILPKGKLIDEAGQYMLRDWVGKSRDVNEVTQRLHRQLREAPQAQWPGTFSRWGGFKDIQFDSTGFFRTHHDGKRWWLVDPDGHPFWSAGQDSVGIRPGGAAGGYEGIESAITWLPPKDGPYRDAFHEAMGIKLFSHFQANFIRAFGPSKYYDSWATIAVSQMRSFGFNTFANWSDWQAAKKFRFPYVRQLHPSLPNTPMAFRDMPDVFHPAFIEDAAKYAEPLRESADDPAFIGYFLMNEPQWGFASELPAEAMILNCPHCYSRRALADTLRQKYGTDAALATAWQMPATFAAVADGPWNASFTSQAKADLEAFSTVMVDRFFRTLSDACRKVDANHLNLGGRYYTVPPMWAQKGMGCFDVFGVNGYSQRVRRDLGPLSEALNRPILVGEWHFGALDVGLPGSGIGHVKDQTARGQAYRLYVEDAASLPWCVGVHYFHLYDEPAQGRYDGENWNIGFIDVCGRPYEPLIEAARLAHERMYNVALGRTPPYADEPEYLPLLF